MPTSMRYPPSPAVSSSWSAPRASGDARHCRAPAHLARRSCRVLRGNTGSVAARNSRLCKADAPCRAVPRERRAHPSAGKRPDAGRDQDGRRMSPSRPLWSLCPASARSLGHAPVWYRSEVDRAEEAAVNLDGRQHLSHSAGPAAYRTILDWTRRIGRDSLRRLTFGARSGLRVSGVPTSRSLTGIGVAAALLIQMLLAMPAALRMTAEAIQWLQLDATICTAHDNGAATDGDGPIPQVPSRHHGHCQLCLTHALP